MQLCVIGAAYLLRVYLWIVLKVAYISAPKLRMIEYYDKKVLVELIKKNKLNIV